MRHDPPSHHKKQVILMFLFRAAVVSPMSGLSSNADGVHCPVSPGDHIVRADNIVIDPMHCAARFHGSHEKSSFKSF